MLESKDTGALVNGFSGVSFVSDSMIALPSELCPVTIRRTAGREVDIVYTIDS